MTLTDGVGNSSSSTSGSVLIGTDTTCTPDVTASGSGVYQAAPNDTVYFKLYGAGTVWLTATVPCSPVSGVAAVDYYDLSNSTGWTTDPDLPHAATSPPYQQGLAPGAGALATAIEVKSVSGLGAVSPARTIDLVPDANPPVVDFGTPDEGSTSVQVGANFVVSWSESDDFGSPGSAFPAGRGSVAWPSPSQESARVPTATGSSTARPSPNPISGATQGLTAGHCYDWQLTISDNVGNAATYTSGSVLVEAAPQAPDVTASGSGVYQSSPNSAVYFRADGGASITLTAASDSPSLGSITLGELDNPTGWGSSPSLPSTVSGTPATQGLQPGPGAGAVSIGAGGCHDGPWLPVSATPDLARPTAQRR